MMDETNTQGGAAVQGDARAERDLTMRDRYEQQHSVTFQNPDSAELWRAILALGTQMSEMQARLSDRINAVDFKLDDLPNRVGKLEIKVDPEQLPVMIPIFLALWISVGFGLFLALLLVGAYFIIA
jgi:hypothetical protein